MAGQRLQLLGAVEISAVCTDPAHRGHGFAARLTRAVAVGIAARGETPFLHAVAANTSPPSGCTRSSGSPTAATVTFPLLRPPGCRRASAWTKPHLSGGSNS